VLVRLPCLEPEQKAALVSRVFFQHERALYGAFSVLSPRALRIRSFW
jgi:hypothetical protein